MPGKSASFDFSQYFSIDRSFHDLLNGMFDELHQIAGYISNDESSKIIHINTTFGLTISDSLGKVMWFNNSFAELTGYSGKSILGNRVRDAMYGKKSIRIDKNYVDENIKNGVPFYFENIGYKKSGTEYWFGVAIFPIYNTKKELFGRLHCIRDITEKKLLVLTAMKNETVINLAIENTDTIFWSFDVSDGHIILSDKQKGFLGSEFINNLEVKVIDTLRTSAFSLDTPKAVINNIEIDTDNTHNDKKVYDLMIKCIEWDSNYYPLQYVGALYDVTIRNKQYTELLEKNKILEKLNSNLDSFVYSASHNLRSPLTSIKGIVEILFGQQLTPEMNLFFISEINRSVDKLDSTIFDIIEYSRNTRTELEVSLIDIENLITRSYNDNKYYNKIDIDFNLTLDINSPFFSDFKRVTSVIDNVITNAIKYCDSSKLQSFIHINVLIDALECVIRIEDNGIGMSEETLAKAFKMFYRGTNKVSGSGLGLFMVKEILDKINGNIKMESKIGEGTKIAIYLKNMH